jgi:peptidoglycan/LPS O-acetylase OafA/YrhL
VTEGGHAPARARRRYDVDWLRVIGMAFVFLFHCARYFDAEGWHVKNPELAAGATVFVSWAVLWIMPLFFVLSGMSTRWSMRRRSVSEFVRSRAARLLVPFLLCTLVVWIPVQVWIERVTGGQFEGSFLEFYPHYFDGWYGFGGNFAWMGLHLWYLQMLFLFSILLLPVFLAARSAGAERALRVCADALARPGAVLLLAAPLIAVELWVSRHPETIGMRAFGGWSPFVYVVFFLLGYLLVTDPRYRGATERTRWVALVVTVASTVLVSLDYWGPIDLSYVAFYSARTLAAWSLLVAMLGFAGRHLDVDSPHLAYANEGILPFYILHQTVIVVLGYAILDWAASPVVKYLVLAAGSLAIIVTIYELGVRRHDVARRLMGMRRRR